MKSKKNEQNYEFVEVEGEYPYFIHVHLLEEWDRINYANVPKLMDHWHKELEIDYVFEGSVDYYIDGERFCGKGDELFLINSGSVHSVFPKKTNCTGRRMAITIIIDYDFLKKNIPDFDESVFLLKDYNAQKEIKKWIHEIADLYETSDLPYKNLLIMSRIYEILYQLCSRGFKNNKSIIPINSQKSVERIRGIVTYIDEHYMEQITQEQIAKKFYFSREYFSRFFKKYTGINYKEYLTKYRLIQALKLLETTDLSMTEIAVETGFCDTRLFINAFKKYYGITPYQYKIS